MKQRTILFWLALVVLSRFPLLVTGYGADGDAWRVAETALRIWNEGIYEVSRFPGFPVYEFLSAVFVGIGGSILSNCATLIIFLFSVYPLKKIIDHWGVPASEMLLVVFSFLPILWKNSAVTMDYVWGLAGILMSIWLVLEKRFLFAGIAFGLVVGTRVTHLAFILPFLYLIPKREVKNLTVFAASTIGIAGACYIPAILFPSWAGQEEYFFSQVWRGSSWKIVSVYLYRVVYSMGLLGAAGLVVIAVMQRSRWKDLTQHQGFMFSTACIFVALAMFSVLPEEREYLIPMMPFLLIVLFLVGTIRQCIVVSILLLSFSFISIDVVDHEESSLEGTIAFRQGLVLKEYTGRIESGKWRDRLMSRDLPDSSVVMIGRGPIFGLENDRVEPARELRNRLKQSCYGAKDRHEVYYVYSLNREQLFEIRELGFTVYYSDDAKTYLERFVGYRLEDENVRKLEM